MGSERQKHNCNFELQTERMENLDKEPSGIQLGTKIKFVGDRAGDQFPSLQGKCTSGKSGLTRSLNSLDAEKNVVFSGHYVIASSRSPERRPLERRTLVPIENEDNLKKEDNPPKK